MHTEIIEESIEETPESKFDKIAPFQIKKEEENILENKKEKKD
jgi:hypothetical protein